MPTVVQTGSRWLAPEHISLPALTAWEGWVVGIDSSHHHESDGSPPTYYTSFRQLVVGIPLSMQQGMKPEAEHGLLRHTRGSRDRVEQRGVVDALLQRMVAYRRVRMPAQWYAISWSGDCVPLCVSQGGPLGLVMVGVQPNCHSTPRYFPIYHKTDQRQSPPLYPEIQVFRHSSIKQDVQCLPNRTIPTGIHGLIGPSMVHANPIPAHNSLQSSGFGDLCARELKQTTSHPCEEINL